MKLNNIKTIANLDNIQDKKIRKICKRVIKKCSLNDLMAVGATLSSVALAVKFSSILKGV